MWQGNYDVWLFCLSVISPGVSLHDLVRRGSHYTISIHLSEDRQHRPNKSAIFVSFSPSLFLTPVSFLPLSVLLIIGIRVRETIAVPNPNNTGPDKPGTPSFTFKFWHGYSRSHLHACNAQFLSLHVLNEFLWFHLFVWCHLFGQWYGSGYKEQQGETNMLFHLFYNLCWW